MMAENKPIYEQECPACGGVLRFDPEKQKLVCDYCGSEFDVDREEKAEEFSLDKFKQAENAESLPIYNCVSCGAEVIANPEQVSLTCPYCGNNIVLTDKIAGSLTPNGIIPFAFTPKDLADRVRKFYKGKRLLPKKFFDDSQLSKVQGVYVPFWLYNSDLTANCVFKGETATVATSGNYTVTTHRHFELDRAGVMKYQNVPVDASKRMDDSLMDSLEPYDFSQMQPFNKRFLSGFVSDRYDTDPENVKERATTRMCNTAAAMIMNTSVTGYSDVSVVSSNVSMANEDVKYVLLPVYMFDVTHEGKKYSYAINGQTGKVIGELPVFKKEKLKWFLGSLAASFGVIGAVVSLILR